MGTERDYDGVRAASASSIEIDFYYAGARCRERIKLKPTPANLKRAAQHRAAILVAIEQGTFDYATTFPTSKRAHGMGKDDVQHQHTGDFLTAWLDSKTPTIKTSTREGYRKIIFGHLLGLFGHIPLSGLGKTAIRQALAQTTCSNKTLANIQSVLRTALADAFEQEIIPTNPLAGWTYRKTQAPKTEDEVDPFTMEEQRRILSASEGQARNLIQFAFWTGLRTSELVALDWADIDWTRNVIRINKAMTQHATAPESTKTRSGNREVKLLAPALAALMDQKQYTHDAWAEIFQNPHTRTRWTGDQPIRKTMWQPVLRAAGVRYRRPYQTRHTYASMMLSAGEHPMWVAQQMGHADWGMIRRIYGRWIPAEVDDAGSKAVALFYPAPSGK